jgi:hypothetical protein
MRLADLEISVPEPPRRDWIPWPLDKTLPDCGATLNAGELGRAVVVEVETSWRYGNRIRCEFVV